MTASPFFRWEGGMGVRQRLHGKSSAPPLKTLRTRRTQKPKLMAESIFPFSRSSVREKWRGDLFFGTALEGLFLYRRADSILNASIWISHSPEPESGSHPTLRILSRAMMPRCLALEFSFLKSASLNV